MTIPLRRRYAAKYERRSEDTDKYIEDDLDEDVVCALQAIVESDTETFRGDFASPDGARCIFGALIDKLSNEDNDWQFFPGTDYSPKHTQSVEVLNEIAGTKSDCDWEDIRLNVVGEPSVVDINDWEQSPTTIQELAKRILEAGLIIWME